MKTIFYKVNDIVIACINRKKMKFIGNSREGSISIEATIVMPITLCILISIVFLIRLFYLHTIIQDVIMDTADELSRYAYIVKVSEAEKLQDSLLNKIDGAAEKIQAYFNNKTGGIIDVDFTDMLSEFGKKRLYELEDISFDEVIKQLIKNRLEAEHGVGVDLFLKRMHVIGGFDGLDFKLSSFLVGGKDIKIAVKYTVDLPLPVDVLPKINILQSTVIRAWMSGDGEDKKIEDENDIWKLPPLERGRKIQSMLGRSNDMPHNFPVIARFQAGAATSIKSINLKSKSYENINNVSEVLFEYINELDSFEGGNVGNYVIKKDEIKSKELLIVLPKGSINDRVQSVLNNCRASALSVGIILIVKEL